MGKLLLQVVPLNVRHHDARISPLFKVIVHFGDMLVIKRRERYCLLAESYPSRLSLLLIQRIEVVDHHFDDPLPIYQRLVMLGGTINFTHAAARQCTVDGVSALL